MYSYCFYTPRLAIAHGSGPLSASSGPDPVGCMRPEPSSDTALACGVAPEQSGCPASGSRSSRHIASWRVLPPMPVSDHVRSWGVRRLCRSETVMSLADQSG